MSMYQLSPGVRMIHNPESGYSMVYHALYGNPRVLNKEGVHFLELFRVPACMEEISGACDGDPEETVKEFVKLYFLVEPGFDEKAFLREQKVRHLAVVSEGRTIDRMGLAISDQCNFGCAHCIHFQPESNGGTALPEYQKPIPELIMRWDTAKQCVDRYVALMRRNGTTKGRIHFGNAEPLINWLIIQAILEYCEAMEDLSFEFAINTNLALLTREIAETLKQYRVRIATSLDGTATANDAIRVTKGGRGTFGLILSKFDLLAEIGYPLDGFSITVTKANFPFVDVDIIDLAAARGMTSIAFDYDLVGLSGVPVAERVERLIRLKRHANERRIDFFGTWDSAFRNLTSESLLFGTHAFCAAVEGRSLEFNVDGSIKVCSHTTTRVGHVSNFGKVFGEAGGLRRLVDERFPGTDAFCSGCAIEGPCGGQCHVTREVVARSVPGERTRLFADMCDFYRAVTEALALEHLQSNGS